MTEEIIIDGINVGECEHSFKQFDDWVGKDVVWCDCTLSFRCEPKENHCKFYMYYLEKQLKAKEQECEEFRKANDEKNELLAKLGCPTTATAKRKVFCLQEQLDQLKAENEKMSKGYSKLTEIVSPYMDDFTGYNEELGGFDIVLCIKELLQQFKHLKTENEKIKESRDYYKRIVDGCPDVCENSFCQIDFYNKKLTKNLTEIKEIAEQSCSLNSCEVGSCMHCKYLDEPLVVKRILQKISEVEE